jgi:hypothetical protein
MAVERNWPLPDSWLGYSQHAFETLPLPTEHISAGEVLAFRDKAFQVYFNDANYLSMVRSKFGEDTYKHIVDMTKHQLKRKHAAPLKAEPTGREGQSYKHYTASMGATEGARV